MKVISNLWPAFVFTFAIVIVLSTGLTAEQIDSARTEQQPRRFSEIHDDLKVFLKAEATAGNDGERLSAIRDICALFVELKHDPRLRDQPTLLGYKNQLWTRLDKLKREFKGNIRRAERQAKKLSREKRSRSEKTDEEKTDEDVAMEQIDTELVQAFDTLSQSLGEQMALVNTASGGPAAIVRHASRSWSGASGGGHGGGAIADNSAELIELIQTTISPDSWDVNGGESSIFFFQPVNALVVRATSEIHEDVGGALSALRRAGR